MKHLSFTVRILGSVVAVGALSCGKPEPSAEVPSAPAVEEPAPSESPQAVAEPEAPDEAADAPVAAAEPVADAPPPDPRPSAPPSLNLAVYGRCHGTGVSDLGGQVFVHYRRKKKAFVHHMDQRGDVSRTLLFEERLQSRHDGENQSFPTEILGIRGRWPDQAYLLAEHSRRTFDAWRIFRVADGGWRPMSKFDEFTDFMGVWPWVDNSLLTHVVDHGDIDSVGPPRNRLMVLHGAGKGPSFGKLRRRKGCKKSGVMVRQIGVSPQGRVAALAYCDDRAYVAQWTPEDREGTVASLGEFTYAHSGLMLADDGTGYVWVDKNLHALVDGRVEHVPLPDKALVDELHQGHDGQPWVRHKSRAWRRADGEWTPVPVPEGATLRQLAGVEHGTPWLRLHKQGVVVQTADATWQTIALPEPLDLSSIPRARQIHVGASGDVWVTGKYFKGKWGGGVPHMAVYTTRAVTKPLECGEETVT